ncbi:peptide ABC transporter substrate-binding protein [Exiguobacterium sp. Leaf187]|uniref:Peptide ABC transporter substrate-binding protein n=1 Tax=Exiguobacterium indicum TaxID=296995 RepID=A0A0V8GCS3_9BACL|nr:MULTISPECIES: peptide ABC transporter substrate-binding protein [Exiguobacterium]AHA28817.1 peptide ABC transporter substrate-binding protein [Exiguobacterium sp. MH3]KQS21581.1 peptide ABC transporter substrate-binding protein [Exiguobacterium sp. Leaf187]KSU48084.1 peptide ABC transporter substrate-binding protein [Exiguobacterium enclense]KTR25998.1 peptide ABC transporter substrate-binding protein [Exiguobacterium indicum]MCQ4091949.1 peptide ABC transporter substrate-binding protein [E
MNKPSKIAFAGLSSIALLAVAACGQGNDENASGSDSKNKKKEVTLVSTTDVPQLDPTKTTDSTSIIVTNNVFEGLYRLDGDNKPTPGIAESVEVSDDKKTYTFKLRKDAKWSDGSAVTADDFIYAWKRALDPKTAAEYAYILQDLKNANKIMAGDAELDELGVKKVDDQTLEVQLEAPAPYFLGLTSFPTYLPLKQSFVEDKGDKFATSVDTMVFNGPFVLDKWQANAGWTYKKNPDYWDKASVKMDQINVKVVKEISTGVNLFESKEVDFAPITSEFVSQYEKSEDYKTRPDARINFLRFNQKNKALKNKNIRKALALGFEKQGITDVILNDGSKPANFIVAKDFTFTPDGEDFRTKYPDLQSYDADAAKKAWDAGLKELGVKTVELSMLSRDEDAFKKVSEYLKGDLEKHLPGLTINIKQQPFKNFLDLESKGDYDISAAGWGPDYQDPMTFLDMWLTGGSFNRMEYSNKKFDDLIKGAKQQADEAKRWSDMQEAEKILLTDDYAIAPIYQKGEAYLQRTNIDKLYRHPFGADMSFKWMELK